MKQTIQKTTPGTLPSAIIALRLLALAAAVCPAATLPVVSDINVIAGTRGVAISLAADAPFIADFSGSNKTAIVRLSGCVYGLSEFSYSDFPAASPLRSITAQEKPAGTITITVSLKQAITLPLKTVQKKNRWMALLCENAVEPYTWNTATDAPPAQPTVQEAPASPEKSIPQTGSLRNVRLLQRGQICELAFEFDREVTTGIQKKGALVTFTTDNIKNGLGTASLNLPANSIFKKVILSETVSKSIPLLTAAITIDTALSESNFNVAFTRGTVLSLFIMERKQQKATLWTSGHGLAWDYRFYDVPSYGIDMETIGGKARRDASQQISREKTFAVKESVPAPAGPAQSPQSPTTDLSAPLTMEETAAAPVPEETTTAMIVTAGNVNIRSKPSLRGAVRGKLSRGDTAYVVKTSDKWYKLHTRELEGFIYSTFVRPVDMAATAPSPAAIPDAQEITASVAAVETPSPTLTRVSTTVSDDIYLSAQSAAPPAPPDRVPDSTVKLVQGIRYTSAGRRDPFEPIIPSSVSLSGLPFAENLSLVGVLYDDDDRIALCEDTRNDNRPFALREHDPVEKGTLLKIYRDKVVFLITEFGISRSFTLQLSKVTDEQEASKK